MDVRHVLWQDNVKIPQKINKHIRIKSTPISQRAAKMQPSLYFYVEYFGRMCYNPKDNAIL